MVRKIPEPAVLSSGRSLILIAFAGTLALAGCGRKGPLDPPPGGYSLERKTTNTAVTDRGIKQAPRRSQEYDEDGRPIAPEGPKRQHPLDWLID